MKTIGIKTSMSEVKTSEYTMNNGDTCIVYRYKPAVGSMQERAIGHCNGIQFDIDNHWAQICLWLDNPTQEELNEFKNGNVEIRFTELTMGLCFTFKFGSLDWMDAPYTPHLSVKLNDFSRQNVRRLLLDQEILFVVMDTVTGLVCHVDELKLNAEFTEHLIYAIDKIKRTEVFVKDKYFAIIKKIQEQLSPIDIAEMSQNRLVVRTEVMQNVRIDVSKMNGCTLVLDWNDSFVLTGKSHDLQIVIPSNSKPVKVTIENLSIDNSEYDRCAFLIDKGATVDLRVAGMFNRLKSGWRHAGIEVGAEATLTINCADGWTNETAILEIWGGANGAGIGGIDLGDYFDEEEEEIPYCGMISIDGATIKAYGGFSAPGIGGMYEETNNYRILIQGGLVFARGGNGVVESDFGGSGIGGIRGNKQYGDKYMPRVCVSGGILSAEGGLQGSGIEGLTIDICSGTVWAKGGRGGLCVSGNFNVRGGSVHIDEANSDLPKSINLWPVKSVRQNCFAKNVGKPFALVHDAFNDLNISAGQSYPFFYGMKDLYSDENGNVYLWGDKSNIDNVPLVLEDGVELIPFFM